MHSYGGGYHSVATKYDIDKLEPCSKFLIQIKYMDPCSDCAKTCEFPVSVYEDSETGKITMDLEGALACSCCSGIVSVSNDTQVFTARQPAMVFEVTVIPIAPYPAPDFGSAIDNQAEPYGSSSEIRTGGVVVQDKSLPYFDRKTTLSPTGAKTEEFYGVVMHEYGQTQPDYDSCCACPSVPRCTRFCVKKEGGVVVGLAAPVEALTTGTDWVIYYEADPDSPVNSFFYLLDPGSTPPATAIALPNSYVLCADPGAERAAIYVKK